MRLVGNPSDLEQVATKIRGLGGAASKIAAKAAPAIRRVQVSQIGGSQTPYGEPWAPLVDGGSADPAIASRVDVHAEGASVVAETDAVAGYHHSGTSRMVARPILPSEARGIPDTWRRELDTAADAVMGEKGRPS
jgi:hypothetical protein